MDAEDKKEAADNAAHEAEEAKSDAYAAAVRAHYAKIAHAKANTQHHLWRSKLNPDLMSALT